MNVLILEDEIYLAQKLSARLQDEGYNPTHYASFADVDQLQEYETILLSTSIQVGNTIEIIKKYPNSIIILLVSYVNDATVTNPLKSGAKDYVIKPFLLDELIRKINHYKECNQLQMQTKYLKDYIDFIFCEVEDIDVPTQLPLLIETNDQKSVDKIVFNISKNIKKEIQFISLNKNPKVNLRQYSHKLIYIYDFHTLKKTAKELLIKDIANLDIVLCSFDVEENFPYNKMEVKNKNNIAVNNNDVILTINDYVKTMVLKFQSKYPDTELSKKLGISRKSLWEKRKKFGIEKVK